MEVYTLEEHSKEGNIFIIKISTDKECLYEEMKVNQQIYRKKGSELKIMIAEMFMTREEIVYEF